MQHNKILIGYWKTRGRAEIARQLLALCGRQWEEKHYIDYEDWLKDKFTIGLPLPNLPYFIDGDLKLTESIAIYRHILRLCGKREYLGRNLNDQALIDSLISLQYDIDTLLVNLFWDKEWKSKLQKNKKQGIQKLHYINKLYGKKTFALDYPSLPDFLFAEMSYYLQKIVSEDYKELPFLDRVRNGINQIPEIKEYYEKKGSLPFVEQGDLAF